MKPGNKILFLDKISLKSHFICPQTWPCEWNICTAEFTSMKCMIKTCDVTFIWDLQLVFRMGHNLHSENMIFSVKTMTKWTNLNNLSKDLHLRSYLTFEMAWRSSLLCQDEWWPACREHGIILMLPGAHRLEWMEVQLTWAHLRLVSHLPAWSSGLPTAAQVHSEVKKKNYN